MPKSVRRTAAIISLFVVVALAIVAVAVVRGVGGDSGAGPNTGPTTSQGAYTGSASTAAAAPRTTARRPATSTTKTPGMRVVGLSTLPRQATDTWRRIQDGGPFASERDGVTFENRERRLPSQPRGYYREYTVPTPGESDRGGRRLVTGQAGEVFYTGDHYESFVMVDPAR